MSCMICLYCDRLVDTDSDLDGIWTSEGEYICESCTEKMKDAMELEELEIEEGLREDQT